jgi:hypothetical protein
VRGSVNPNGEPTATTLEFGSTAALGGRCTPDLQLPAANTVTTIKCKVSPNAPGVTVFYRIWAQNASGTSRGAIMSYTTLTSGPSSVSSTAASRPMIEGIADRLIQGVQATGPLDAITSMPRAAWWTSPSTPALITARMKIVEQR